MNSTELALLIILAWATAVGYLLRPFIPQARRGGHAGRPVPTGIKLIVIGITWLMIGTIGMMMIAA